MISEQQLVQIETVLDRLGGLDALWVFGSEAAGMATPSSDIDLAALFASSPSLEALWKARADVESIVGRPVARVLRERLGHGRA